MDDTLLTALLKCVVEQVPHQERLPPFCVRNRVDETTTPVDFVGRLTQYTPRAVCELLAGSDQSQTNRLRFQDFDVGGIGTQMTLMLR
jgi:hypothetical protein